MRSCSSLPTGSSVNAVTTAVSRPKQRFSPRATLYSPPPSQTSKDRAVAMRRSPGSSRTMTSPKLTRSQRQSSFGLIVNPMLSPRLPIHGEPAANALSRFAWRVSRFTLGFSVDLGWLQPGSQNMDYGESHQIGGTGNKEWNLIAPSPLKHVAHDGGDEQPPDRTRHASDSHHRTDGPSGKHV